MSFVPQRPVFLHIHVTFSQNDHASYLESESFLFLPSSNPPTSHLTASAEHKTLITSCLLHFDHKPEASFVCCSDPLDVTGNGRGSGSVRVKLQQRSALEYLLLLRSLWWRVFLWTHSEHEWELSVGWMKEATAYERSRHMQPSARPWTWSIRQHYILRYSSLGTESCRNGHELKGNRLELFQLNPQGIWFRPVWPPD